MFNENINTYNVPLSHEYIRHIRLLRNKNQCDFAEIMGVDQATLSKLETGEIRYSELYDSRLRRTIRHLRVSRYELNSIKTLIEYKKMRGYK